MCRTITLYYVKLDFIKYGTIKILAKVKLACKYKKLLFY